jgi:hypothetical protein
VKRLAATLGAAALVFAFGTAAIGVSSGVASATPISPSTSTCTYQDTTAGGTAAKNFIGNVTPGDTIAINCTGLPDKAVLLLAAGSGLADIEGTGETFSDFFDTSAVGVATASATGTLSTTFSWPTSFKAANAAAACPPTQAQINAGVVGCILEMGDFTTGAQLNRAFVVFKGTTPASATLTATNDEGIAGGTIDLTGGANWWPAGYSGAPGTSPSGGSVGGPSMLFIDSAGTQTTLTPSGYALPHAWFCGAGTSPNSVCAGKPANTLVPSTPPPASVSVPSTAATGEGLLCLIEPDIWNADPSASTVSVLPGNLFSVDYIACLSYNVLLAPPVIQPLTQQVNGAQLVLSCDSPSNYATGGNGSPVTSTPLTQCPEFQFPSVTLDGLEQHVTGTTGSTSGNPSGTSPGTIYISDNRGSPTDSWTLTGTFVPTTIGSGNGQNPNSSCAGVDAFCNGSIGSAALNTATNGAHDGQIAPSFLQVGTISCDADSTGGPGGYNPPNLNPDATPTTGGNFGSPVSLCAASTGQSGGTFLFNATYTLTIPESVYAGSYFGTVQYTVA